MVAGIGMIADLEFERSPVFAVQARMRPLSTTVLDVGHKLSTFGIVFANALAVLLGENHITVTATMRPDDYLMTENYN